MSVISLLNPWHIRTGILGYFRKLGSSVDLLQKIKIDPFPEVIVFEWLHLMHRPSTSRFGCFINPQYYKRSIRGSCNAFIMIIRIGGDFSGSHGKLMLQNSYICLIKVEVFRFWVMKNYCANGSFRVHHVSFG